MPDPRTKLYQALSGKFDLGSQDEFNSKMDNPESRKKLYSAVSNDFDLGSYEDFEGKVASVKKKENSTSTGPSKKLVSGETTGSSAGVDSKGFPKIDTNSVAPDFDTMKPAVSSKKTTPSKKEEKRGFLSKKLDDLATGSAQLGADIAAIPELAYDFFAIPQNAIGEMFDIPMMKTDSEGFKKNIGVKNKVKEFYQGEVVKNREKSKIVDEQYKEGVYDSFKNGDYAGGFDQLTSSFAESLPATASIMVGGAYAKGAQLLAASTMTFGAGKNEQLKDENPEMSTNARVANALGTGLAEGAFETMGSGSIGSAAKGLIEREGVEKGTMILKDGLVNFYKEALKKNPFTASLAGEGIEEWATQVTQNSIDVATGSKAKDYNVFTGATDAFIGGAFGGSVFGGGLQGIKQIVNIQDRNAVKNNTSKIFELQTELGNSDLSETTKLEINKNIDGLISSNQKLIQKGVSNVESLSPEVKDKLIESISILEASKNKAKAISLDNTSDSIKKTLLDNLKAEAKEAYDFKNSILEGKTTVVDVLPLKEQETLKKQAMEDLVTELNPDGKKDITISNEQVVERANQIYNESKANEIKQESAAVENSEPIQEPAKVETKEISPVVEQTTPDTKSQPTEVEVEPSVSEITPAIKKNILDSYKNKTVIKLPLSLLKNIAEFDRKSVNDEKNKIGVANISELKESIATEGLKEPLKVILNSKGNILLVEGNHRIVALEELGHKEVPVFVVERSDVLKDILKDKAEQDYYYRNGKKLGLNINLDLKNEAAPQSNTPADGNVRPGVDSKETQEKNNELQPSTKSPTNKGEVGSKLIDVNKRVFGLDDEKSKSSAVVMEKTIETMAERVGISKEKMFDKIDFEKGDAKTAEKLSKKGNALFQIIGKNAKLSKDVKQFLSNAKSLEKKGTDAKDIFIQTGWEKGADGKWKYDMQEGKVEFKKTENGNLEDVLDYKELFDKYPEARKIKIVFDDNMNYSGLFHVTRNRIHINNSNGLTESRLTILHELQHWIQNKEGFSTGGNEVTVRRFINDQIKNATDDKVKKSIAKFKDLISKNKTNSAKINEELSKLKEFLNKEDFDLYESIAGEVEARNVEQRFNMPLDQRKATPLSQTEDVARDEQIVLFQGEQGAMLAEDGKFIIYALTDPNVSTPLHEMAHVYEHYLTEAERTAILENAGHDVWSRETSEHFARGFEKYLTDGIAPSPEIKSVFDNFKKWMNEIYTGIRASDINIKISPEMKKVFDMMLGAKEAENTNESKTVAYRNGEFTVKTNEKGEVKIFKKDGTEVQQYTQRKLKNKVDNKDVFKQVKNANYYKILAISEGGLSENEINLENKKQIQESIDNFIPTSEYEHALLEIANGAKFSKESIQKEVGNLDSKWATDQFAKKKLPSIENVAEAIVSNTDFVALDEQEVRNHLIDIIASFGGINDVKESIHELYQKSIDPYQGMNEQDAIEANIEYMTDAEKALYESVQNESNLTEEEKLNHYKDEYRKQFQSLTGEQQQQIYEQEEQGRINSNEGNAISDSRGSAEKQEQNQGIDEKSTPDQILEWLENAEKELDAFGRENLSVGIPIVVAKTAIQAMKLAVKAGKLAVEIIQAGLDSVKQSDWFKNLTQREQADIENDFQTNFLNKITAIDPANERQAENLLHRAASENISEDDAYDEVKSTFDKARTELKNKKLPGEYVRDAYRNFVKRFTDRQYLAKSLLNKSGMKAVQNLIINSHGASGKAKIQFEEAYNEIYKKLTTKERATLDEIIQAKRFIAIDSNREARGLEPVSHPNFIDKNKSEKFLSKLEKELGTEKYNDLVKRADAYFETYKGLLKDMLDNGLISKESFDSMSDVDYQPRVFLQFVTDFNGDLETNKRTNNLDSGGLSSDQIKSMSEGDANSLVLNSEWLLTNSLLSRSKAMAMNNINKRFITGEFKDAKKRFEALDPKNLKGDDVRFYKYFKELSSKVIDNPVTGQTDSGNSKHIFDKTPPNFAKAYYYMDGQRHEFFLEKDLHESWNDNVEGFLSSDAKEFISYASGAALVKAIATGNNPAFPIVNTPRDFLFTATFSDQYSKIVPKAMIQIAKDVVKSIKEIRKPQSDVLKKYIEYGGAMDFLSSQGTLKKESLIGQALDKSVSANTRDIAKSVFSKITLHKISQYSEMMFRLGIFQRAIKNQVKELGFNDISEVTDKQQLDDIYNQAVSSARSILDFNQGGSITKDLESVIPYINVAFQGGRVAAGALEKDPVGTTSRILQVATLASAVPIGMSLALISAMKSDDDDDKSAYEIYLHALSGISRYQKMKYMNIVTGKKNDEGEYQVIKIAKAQELSPVMSVTDEIYNNLIRRIAGKEKKSAASIADDALFTFNSNVMPIDATSPAGLITRTPIVKATLTYATGYDFFREEPLSMDIGKVPKPVEGITMSSTEDFYKKLGENYGLSPIRSKAFVESLITGPSTNPFVGMLYGGADAATSDKDMKKIGSELFDAVYKSTGKRVVSYSSDFNRQLAGKKDLQDKIDAVNMEKYRTKAKFNDLTKQFIAKEITKSDLDSKLNELEPIEKKRMLNKIKDKIRMKDIDGTILDIKYEQGNEAKALMIMHYYGDIFDGSKDNKSVLRQMQKAKGILTPATLQQYNKIKKQLGTKKRPD